MTLFTGEIPFDTQLLDDGELSTVPAAIIQYRQIFELVQADLEKDSPDPED